MTLRCRNCDKTGTHGDEFYPYRDDWCKDCIRDSMRRTRAKRAREAGRVVTPPNGWSQAVPQARVDELRHMHENGLLVAYCESVLDGLVDRMCGLIDRDVA